MIEMSFFTGLWLSFAIIALSSFGVFFARSLKDILMASSVVLSGISLQILNTDLFRSIHFGQFIILSLWFLFLFQSLFFGLCIKAKVKKNFIFYALPFLAFITMSISLDLITILLALTLFSTAFTAMALFKGKDKKLLIQSIQKLCVSFLAFSYGLTCLYSREGTIHLKDLYLKLGKGNWDGLTSVGAGLLFLSILIEVYAVIPLIEKKK